MNEVGPRTRHISLIAAAVVMVAGFYFDIPTMDIVKLTSLFGIPFGADFAFARVKDNKIMGALSTENAMAEIRKIITEQVEPKSKP